MIAGIAIGGLAAVAFQKGDISQAFTKKAIEKPTEKTEGVDGSKKPRFDFYTLLKETEVIVADEQGASAPPITPAKPVEEQKAAALAALDTKPAAEAPPPTKDSAPKPSANAEVYVLQAGSFKHSADADSVRARLLLLNMRASIEKVSPSPGETWHRVLVGPFTNLSELASARAVLTQNGIDSIQLKRRL